MDGVAIGDEWMDGAMEGLRGWGWMDGGRDGWMEGGMDRVID